MSRQGDAQNRGARAVMFAAPAAGFSLSDSLRVAAVSRRVVPRKLFCGSSRGRPVIASPAGRGGAAIWHDLMKTLSFFSPPRNVSGAPSAREAAPGPLT